MQTAAQESLEFFHPGLALRGCSTEYIWRAVQWWGEPEPELELQVQCSLGLGLILGCGLDLGLELDLSVGLSLELSLILMNLDPGTVFGLGA